MIEKAREFATAAHAGQVRWGGEPYITHPEAVAKLVEDMGGDETAIVTAWLHDIIEDCDIDEDQIQDLFGEDVAYSVGIVTHMEYDSYLEYITDILVMEDIPSILVKIADLTHNISTLQTGKDGKKNQQRRNSYELARWILLDRLSFYVDEIPEKFSSSELLTVTRAIMRFENPEELNAMDDAYFDYSITLLLDKDD